MTELTRGAFAKADPSPAHHVDGIDVYVDGNGPRTLVMLHGWPDTHRLWNRSILELGAVYRCVRLTLPGFDVTLPARATSLANMTAFLLGVVDTVSPDQPVMLMLHDWGCVFGYELAMRHPSRVRSVVGVDVGDHNSAQFARSLSARERLGIMAYQVWLALAWKLEGRVGDRMTRWMARRARCRAAPELMGWQMNYPYAMQWLGLAGGLGDTAPVDLQCPLLYIYGERKPFMFHSPEWVAALAGRPGCAARGFPTGHWVMVEQPDAFHRCVLDWLAATP